MKAYPPILRVEITIDRYMKCPVVELQGEDCFGFSGPTYCILEGMDESLYDKENEK